MLFENKDNKPRKKSYYPFSRNYPGKRGNSYDIGESRTRRKKEKRYSVIFGVGMVFLFVAVFIVASVSMKLSSRPVDSGNKGVAEKFDGQLKALYMPDDVLSGGIAFDLFKTQLSDMQANAVVIDFKKQDGTLNYNTSNKTALDINASASAYENAESTIEQLKSNGYKIIARIYCYEDVLAASKLPNTAATEADMTSIWLDDSAQNDGNPWLNPYSKPAENYIVDIVSETVSLGVDAVMLSSVSFPDSTRSGTAFFPGESESIESRNFVLHSFVERVAAVCGEVPVMVYMNADGAINGSNELYGGGIFDSAATFNVVDVRMSTVPTGFTIGDSVYSPEKYTQNSFIQSVIPLLNSKLDENYSTKGIIPVIDDKVYVSTLQNLGINNYILILK